MVSIVVYKCRHVGVYQESEEDEMEMLDQSGAHEETEVYKPRSTREKQYDSMQTTEPAGQAFI